MDLLLTPGFGVRLAGFPAALRAACATFFADYPTQPPDPRPAWRVIRWKRPSRLPEGSSRVGGIDVHRDARSTVLVDGPSVAWHTGLDSGFVLGQRCEPATGVIGLLVPLLVELAGNAGWYALHAAAFGREETMLLLPGPSGAGKSTLYRRAAAAGLDLLSDDLVWLGPEGKLAAFPRGAPAAPAPRPTRPGGRVVALVFPSITPLPESQLRPATARHAMQGLADAAASLAAGEALATRFRRLAKLVARIAAWQLEAGSDKEAVIARLANLLPRACDSEAG